MESKQRLLEPQLVQTGRADQFSRKVFCDGMRDGVPIALGYFAVSFSLGIAARKAGFTPLQGFLVSLLNNASAGEYAAFALIMANATYFEVAVITLIANARYLLMSCALAQRFAGETFGTMETPVLFNCLGHEKAETDSIPQLLVKQVQSSVYMEDTLRRLGELGVDHILEVGPGNALSGFVKKTLPGVVCTAVETPEQLDAVLTAWKDAE